ncbi:MAG: WecB/TagA/CpsF family glycosyltransferase [Thermoflexales bacterium]|nr:WecB/TagA/CpsF family glycosyltransferase [Thermoflexales bacterium]
MHDVTLCQACDIAEALIQRGGAYQFATVNPEFIMAAQRDPEFMALLQQTALNVPDGVGVLWAARRLGQPLRERVAGVDLVQALCGMASAHRWRTFFLGAQPGVAERAAARMAERFPGLMICGTFAGTPREEDAPAIVKRIANCKPQLLFVAYGAPAQDKWLARHLREVLVGEQGLVGVGVGGAFDFIAGVQQRAPLWMQRAGLEWLHRLVRQPWRWRRQLALIRFVFAVLLESARKP